MQEGEFKTLNLLIKTDVQGSVEALTDTLERLSNEEVKVKVVHGMVGAISESDVNLAVASQAIIIGFNVRADSVTRRLIESEGVDVHYYNVIYDAVNDIKDAIEGLRQPKMREQIIGLAEVRDVFRARKIGAIAGCYVTEGVVKRNWPIRVLRDNVVIFEGELESLRRFKEDAGEVKAGLECGIGVKNYNDVNVGDQIEVYERIEVARSA
jgi:translation initiation factor IF-2